MAELFEAFIVRLLDLLDSHPSFTYVIEQAAHLRNLALRRPDLSRRLGAHEYTNFFRIIFPLSMPVFATILLFDAVWHWNSWFDAILFAPREGLETLMSILARMLLELRAREIVGLKVSKGVMIGAVKG